MLAFEMETLQSYQSSKNYLLFVQEKGLTNLTEDELSQLYSELEEVKSFSRTGTFEGDLPIDVTIARALEELDSEIIPI